VTNPKVILFFVAFFPLFIQPQASALTLTVMMAHVTAYSARSRTRFHADGGQHSAVMADSIPHDRGQRSALMADTFPR
jgi:threonine/homoserine/homoserine lactone efflux protein